MLPKNLLFDKTMEFEMMFIKHQAGGLIFAVLTGVWALETQGSATHQSLKHVG